MRIDAQDALRRLQSSKNLANLSVPGSDDAVASLNRPSNPATSQTVPEQEPQGSVRHETLTHAHRLGKPNVPEFLRNVIGYVAEATGQPCREVGEAFDVSRQTVDQAKTGKVGGRPANAERLAVIEERKLDIKDTALVKLMTSLNLITEEDLSECSPKELSGIAVNMSKVASTLAEKEIGLNGVNVVVYAPQMREESRFKVVDV